MKKSLLPLMFLSMPLYAQAPLPELLKELQDVRSATSLCSMEGERFDRISGSLSRVSKRGKEGFLLANEIRADFNAAREACNEESKARLASLSAEINAADAEFPMQIMAPFVSVVEDRKLNLVALDYIKTKEANPCHLVKKADQYDVQTWHQTLLDSGWSCVANNYVRLSNQMNETTGYTSAQADLNAVQTMNLPQLKTLFKDLLKKRGNAPELKVAFVPQLTWENGALNTTWPYSLFTDKTELTSYQYLTKEFKKLGVKAKIISRNSLSHLSNQVAETREGIQKLDGPHLIISRSMGSRVMRELVVENNATTNANISAWFNVGGTPHGSVIAQAKAQPDMFYQDPVPTALDALKLPVRLVALDPRIPDHLEATLYAALIRGNLLSMVPVAPRHLSESELPVLNAVFVRNDHVRAVPDVDPVWMHMLQQGPTEGSAPIHGATVDTNNSMRLILEGDHLGFWKFTPREALEIYLRLLIVGMQDKLVK